MPFWAMGPAGEASPGHSVHLTSVRSTLPAPHDLTNLSLRSIPRSHALSPLRTPDSRPQTPAWQAPLCLVRLPREKGKTKKKKKKEKKKSKRETVKTAYLPTDLLDHHDTSVCFAVLTQEPAVTA